MHYLLDAMRHYRGLPEWMEMISLVAWYAFSGVATLYFTLLIPTWLRGLLQQPTYGRVERVERYTKPLAKGAYKAGTWLAPAHALLQCVRLVGAILYLLV